MSEKIGVLGSGAIASGVAAVATSCGQVVLCARSEESAARARKAIDRFCSRAPGTDPTQATIVTEVAELADRTFVIEAIAESLDAKSALLATLEPHLQDDAIVATTTSSLSVTTLAAAGGRPGRFCGLHVFNPVTKMALVELVFPADATEDTRTRAHAVCLAFGKTPVEVPDAAGFVVNRLLFPYLFDAVRLQERTGMPAADIDECMKLGAGHPMGPLALIDLVGLDISLAIGEMIDTEIPEKVREMIAAGHLGRKTKRGFHDYT